MLSPEFFTSASVARLTVPARYTFAGLWVYCDDQGRGEDEPLLVKATVWPRDKKVTERVVASHLDELEREGHIHRYVDDRALLHIPAWSQHQKISHPTPPKLWPCLVHEPEAHAIFSALAPEPFHANVVEVSPDQGSSSGEDLCPHDDLPNLCRICNRRKP